MKEVVRAANEGPDISAPQRLPSVCEGGVRVALVANRRVAFVCDMVSNREFEVADASAPHECSAKGNNRLAAMQILLTARLLF